MAFRHVSLGPSGFGGSTGGSSSVQVQTGPDLEEIETEVSDCICIEASGLISGSARLLDSRHLPGTQKSDSCHRHGQAMLSHLLLLRC